MGAIELDSLDEFVSSEAAQRGLMLG